MVRAFEVSDLNYGIYSIGKKDIATAFTDRCHREDTLNILDNVLT